MTPDLFTAQALKPTSRARATHARRRDGLGWAGQARYHGVMPLKEGYHRLVGRYRINLTFRKAA